MKGKKGESVLEKRFVLRVYYGTGSAAMLTGTPDLVEALEEFLENYKKAIPDAKMYGLPSIIKAEIIPLMYQGTMTQ